MNTFYFYVDEKVTTWMRTNFSVSAENEEEAKKKAKEFVDNEKHNDIFWEEIRDIVPEKMNPVENDGQPTVELYTEYGEFVSNNVS